MSQNPEADTPTDARDDSTLPPEPERRAYTYWLLTLFVVFTGSLVSVSWYGWMLFQTNNTRINSLVEAQQHNQARLQSLQQTDHDELAALRAQLDQRLTAVQSGLTDIQQHDQTLSQQTEQRLHAVEHSLARLQDQLGRGALAWQVQEITDLLNRAQEQLSIARNPTGTRAALLLADQHLAALARPEVLPVRAAISDALQGLQRAEAFDAVGMSLSLRRAVDSVSEWPLKGQTPTATAAEPAPASPPSAAEAPWYIRWPQALWQPVADWVSQQFVVTRDGAPASQGARQVRDQEMRLWLTGLREALMARDDRSILAATAQATDWLDAHYDTHAPAVAAVQAHLRRVADFYQARDWPNLNPIFQAWRATGLTAPANAPATTATHGAPAITPEAQP